MAENNLEHVKDWFIKIIQLYETSIVRHGFMVCGTAGSGKTTIMDTLTKSLTLLADDGNALGNLHKLQRMNPKAITTPQLYGIINGVGEWVPGVFSEIWKKSNAKANKHITWIVCDGPVDAIWIENLNTVLDHNKILTLANNERIPMSDNTKMVFEVENLNNASPATVSRCGIIFVSPTDLFWEPLIKTWCRDRTEDKTQSNPDETAWCEEFTQKYILKMDLQLILNRDYHYVMPLPEVVRITQLLNLLTSLLAPDVEAQRPVTKANFEKLWVYSCAGLMVVFLNKMIEKSSINILNLEVLHFHQSQLKKCPLTKNLFSITMLMRTLKNGLSGRLNNGCHQRKLPSLNYLFQLVTPLEPSISSKTFLNYHSSDTSREMKSPRETLS